MSMKKILRAWQLFALLVAAILVGAGSTWAGLTTAGADEPRFATAAVTSSPPASPSPATTWDYKVGYGTFAVPAEVRPGRYEVVGDGGALGCHWARLKSDDDKTDSIIDQGTLTRGSASDNVFGHEHDKFLRFSGGGMWTRR